MAKPINKLKLSWLGRGIFLEEIFRVLARKGISGIKRYLRWLTFAVGDERLVEHNGKGIIHLFIPPIPSRSFSRIIRSYNDTYVLQRKQIPLHNMLISTTKRCPFKCWYCSATDTPDNEIEIEDLEKIIATLRKWNICIIGFTGGEPLLRTDTDEIIRRYANEFTFIIFTSGYGLDFQRARKLKDYGLFYIAISLDDFDKTRHDKARGLKGAFENSIKAIKNAKKAGLYTIVQSVITKAMFSSDRIWKFINYVKELDADELLLLEPLGTGRLLCSDNGIFLDEETRLQLKDLHDIAIEKMDLPKIYSFAHIEHPTQFGCDAGIHHAYIDTIGNLWPCNFLPISLGNILKEPDIIYNRLIKYFSRPCEICILMKERKYLQKLFDKTLPIPFEKAKIFLEDRQTRMQICGKPTFYKLMERK
jgi:MoaA/NifB/PqqE/SkfB family radical SAM enzyme